MSAEEEYELFSDPRRAIEDGRVAKVENQRRLAAIFAPPEPEPAADAIDELADRVTERLITRLDQPEPESQVAGAARGGFDGGARPQSISQPPESHGEWLTRVLRERRADRGAAF